jgi:hypothetical protein
VGNGATSDQINLRHTQKEKVVHLPESRHVKSVLPDYSHRRLALVRIIIAGTVRSFKSHTDDQLDWKWIYPQRSGQQVPELIQNGSQMLAESRRQEISLKS